MRSVIRSLLWPLSIATTAGMFIVLVMGAAVTNTGSAEGCGRSWPLCNGQFVPEMAVASLIEYSHRAITGVEGILVACLTLSVLLVYPRGREIWILAPLMMVTLILQAGLGALAVLYPQTPAVLASHFGISLAAFASVFLTMMVVRRRTGAPEGATIPVPASHRVWAWGTLIYLLVVVYLGAYVRHTGMSLACTDWPLCQGQIIPSLSGGTGIVFIHRIAAAIAVVLIAMVARVFWPGRHERPDLAGAALAALALIVLQVFSGALVVWTLLGLFSTLAHAGLVALLGASVSYLCLEVTRGRRAAEEQSALSRPLAHRRVVESGARSPTALPRAD